MTTSSDRGARYADARRILDLAGANPRLPFPHLSERRASFHFSSLTAREASEGMLAAEAVLAREFGVTFTDQWTRFGSMTHFIRKAELASGITLSLVTQAITFAATDETAPGREMAEVTA